MVQSHLLARQKRQRVGQPSALLGAETERVGIGHVDGDDTAGKIAGRWFAYQGYGGGLDLGECGAARAGPPWWIAWTLAAWVLCGQGYGRGPVGRIESLRCCARHGFLLLVFLGPSGPRKLMKMARYERLGAVRSKPQW